MTSETLKPTPPRQGSVGRRRKSIPHEAPSPPFFWDAHPNDAIWRSIGRWIHGKVDLLTRCVQGHILGATGSGPLVSWLSSATPPA